MNPFEAEMQRRLDTLREEGLYRELRKVESPQAPRIEMGGRTLLNFSSNDYLGLANEPALKEAAIRAVERFGAGSGAARLICGSLAPHHELEEALARFKGTEAALSFSTGYMTALGTIGALVGREDIVIIDKLVHASIVDGARLSNAKLRVFAHNDLDELESILRWTAEKSAASVSVSTGSKTRVLIITESVFSMDGDCAPLREIVELKDRYGAWLMVDEAHATGLFGANRRGCVEEAGVTDRIEIQMGTLGKALGAAGGYICGSRALLDFLVNRARSFIFSTAPVPAAAAAATAGVQFVASPFGAARCEQLWSLVQAAGRRFAEAGWPVATPASAILPLIVGDENKALAASARLRERGLFIPAIRYPTVARGQARLRVTLTASHSPDDVEQLATELASLRHA